MKTILAPTDFSMTSINAIDYAVEIAKLTKAKLILFNVFQIPFAVSEAPIVLPVDEVEEDFMKRLKEIENDIYKKHGDKLIIECRCTSGFPIDEINQCAIENKADLIVVGMKGAGYLGERLIGSTATSLIKRANCPVLLINEHMTFKSIKKIVLAYDYKKVPAKQVMSPLKEFADIFGSEVYVLNVVNEIGKLLSVKKSVIGIEHNLEGINHSFHFVENEDTIAGINEFVTEEKADMIAIIPRQHTFLDTVLHEKNSKRMAFHTNTPLLALHE